MKPFIVVFGDRGARIVKGVNPSDWQGMPNVLVNPDLEPVRGVPPHLWAMADGKLIVGSASKEPGSGLVFAPAKHKMGLFWLKVAALSAVISFIIHLGFRL